MIDVRELTIGSLVADGMGAEYEVVVISGPNGALDLLVPGQAHTSMYTNCASVEPIPLTAEWLERLGFVEGDDSWAHKTEPIGDIMKPYTPDDHSFWVSFRPASSVHKLQQLVFANYGVFLTPTTPTT